MPPYDKQYPDFHLPPQRSGQRPSPSPADQAAARRKSLGILAVVLVLLMAILATAGLDNLPRRLRDSVNSAQTRLVADKSQFSENRRFIERAIKDEPDLFRTKAADWISRLSADQSRLSTAESELGALTALANANKRSDAAKVEQGLKQFESDRTTPLTDAENIRAEAARWLTYKRELPTRLAAMQRAHDAIDAFDVNAAASAASKAEVDWPAKKADLDTRLAALTALKADAGKLWTDTAAIRAQAAQPKPENLDYAALFQSADQLDQTQSRLTSGAAGVNALAGQLYDSWDKLLLEVSDDDGYKQRVRVVRTHFADASLTNGKVTQDEKWEPLDSSLGRERERNAGMVIERKPAGKYDSEAERVVQAPAYAYIAPPGQSNAYGAWNNGVWTWLPQYLILRDLLQPRYNRPITTGDWSSYDMARRGGNTWYGPGDAYRYSRPYSGRDGGGFYHERSSKPTFGSRGFGGSRYESRGTFSGSRYQSRSSRSFGSRSFSRGSFGGGRGRR